MDREKLRKIWDAAVDLKREGKFNDAISKYEKAIELEPNEVMTYYGMAKVYFLLKDKEKSIFNYLIACHLSLKNMKKHIAERNETGILLEYQLNNLDQDIRKQFYKIHNDAPLILLDPNIPRHIGHSLILLDEIESKTNEVIQHSEQYRLAISGKNGKPSDYLEMTIFQPKGIMFLIKNIIWNKLESENPVSFYNHFDIYRIVRNIAKRVEEITGFDVYNYEVIDFSKSDDFEWSMGWGIGLEKPNEKFKKVFVCYIALEIDHWDYIVKPGHRTLSKEEVKINVEKGMDYFQATTSGDSISDWEFEAFFEDLLKTKVAPIGAIKADDKKYRTFKWVITQ